MKPHNNPILLAYLEELDENKTEVGLTILNKLSQSKSLEVFYDDDSSDIIAVKISHNEFMEAWPQFYRIWRGFTKLKEIGNLDLLAREE